MVAKNNDDDNYKCFRSIQARSRGHTLSNRSLQDPIIVTENKSEEHGWHWGKKRNIINFQAIILSWLWVIDEPNWSVQQLDCFQKKRIAESCHGLKPSLDSHQPLQHLCLPLLHVPKYHAFTWHQSPEATKTTQSHRSSTEGTLHYEQLLHVLTSLWKLRLAMGRLTWFLWVGETSIFLAPIQPYPQDCPLSPPRWQVSLSDWGAAQVPLTSDWASAPATAVIHICTFISLSVVSVRESIAQKSTKSAIFSITQTN